MRCRILGTFSLPVYFRGTVVFHVPRKLVVSRWSEIQKSPLIVKDRKSERENNLNILLNHLSFILQRRFHHIFEIKNKNPPELIKILFFLAFSPRTRNRTAIYTYRLMLSQPCRRILETAHSVRHYLWKRKRI